MTTSMPHSLGRRQLLRQGAIFIGAGGALSILGASGGTQASTKQPTSPTSFLPLHPSFPTSPLDALPKPVRDNLDTAMRAAINVAQPVTKSFGYGAVLVDVTSGQIVAEAANTGGADPSAHAELNVLREYSIKKTTTELPPRRFW